MEAHALIVHRRVAERLEMPEMRFRDPDLRRHADGRYV